MRRRWVVFVLIGGLLAAACGDNSRVSNAASDEAKADATLVTMAAVETVPGGEAGTTYATTPLGTTQPLGGVSIDDPLPAQTDAATDPVTAEAAVRFAYQHWILVDLDKNLRASLIENGSRTSMSSTQDFRRPDRSSSSVASRSRESSSTQQIAPTSPFTFNGRTGHLRTFPT